MVTRLIRGGIFRIDFGPRRGREPAGRRFGVVLSEGPHVWPTAVVAPVTARRVEPAAMRPQIEFRDDVATVLADHLRAIDVRYIDDQTLGLLNRFDMIRIEEAVMDCLLLVPPMRSRS
jgi:mRNA-degrading endonuclease toxin of MazEF toxin-antitoxin module